MKSRAAAAYVAVVVVVVCVAACGAPPLDTGDTDTNDTNDALKTAPRVRPAHPAPLHLHGRTADHGTVDAGTTDAATDAGTTDDGTTDDGTVDAGTIDDAGTTDDGTVDAGTTGGGEVARLFVGVGYGGRVIRSDGASFISDVSEVPNGADDDRLLRDVCFGDGVFVAVGGSRVGRMMRSADGLAWERHDDNNGWLGGCAFGDGVFVAAGSSRAIRSVDDGQTWGDASTHFEWKVRDVAFANGVFVATGDTGIYTSHDQGLTWSQTSTHAFKHVTGGAGFVAAGGGAQATSSDGTSWSIASSNAKDAAWDGTRFVIVTGAVDHLACAPVGAASAVSCVGSSWPNALHRSSDDGVTWTNESDPSANALEAFAVNR